MLKMVIRWTALGAVLIAFFWAYRDPRLEAWLAAASALVVLLGSFLPGTGEGGGQSQSAHTGSTAIQAGRDVKVTGSIRSDKG